MRDKTAKEAEVKLDKYYDISAPSNTTVNRRMQEFKFGRASRNEEPRLGMPSDATTLEMIKKILRLVTDDRKLEVREIYKMVNISTERVHNIFHNHLSWYLTVRYKMGICHLLS